MAYDPEKHHRRSIRLPHYDYARAGAYFVTLCTGDHRCLFGRIEGEEMRLTRPGEIANECWRAIPTHFPQAALDEFIVMPNHVHGIIWIMDAPVDTQTPHPVGANNHSPNPVGANHHLPGPVGANHHLPDCRRANHHSPLRRPHGTSKTIGSIIRGFKIGVTKWMRENAGVRDIWQRNYFEHVIRNDVALHRIRQYIVNNPSRWAYDRLNPLATNPEPDDASGQ